MLYIAKTDVARQYDRDLMPLIDRAQLQWTTYATLIGSAYTTAYELHAGALEDVSEKYRIETDMAYWILALVCVSFAGGLVGGLMTPWAISSGAKVGAAMAVGSASQGAQIATQKVIDESKPAYRPFKPVVKSPTLFYQDLVGGLGLYASDLRGDVEDALQTIDASGQLDPGTIYTKRKVMSDRFIKDTPDSSQMPKKKELAELIEYGMWIAWANFRDYNYWRDRLAALSPENVKDRGNPLRAKYWHGRPYSTQLDMDPIYVDDLHKLDPVLRRLEALGKAGPVTLTARFPRPAGMNTWYSDERVLDINKLRVVGWQGPPRSGSEIFLSYITQAVREPMKLFASLSTMAPQHKR